MAQCQLQPSAKPLRRRLAVRTTSAEPGTKAAAVSVLIRIVERLRMRFYAGHQLSVTSAGATESDTTAFTATRAPLAYSTSGKLVGATVTNRTVSPRRTGASQ